MRSIALVLFITLALAACAEPVGYAGSGSVVLRVRNTGLEIENQRTRPIYYFAVERSTAARILWGPCDRPATCPSVAPGRSVGVSSQDIYGWGESEEVLLYWWHLIPTHNGGFRVDSVRHMVGRLP